MNKFFQVNKDGNSVQEKYHFWGIGWIKPRLYFAKATSLFS